MLVKWRPLLRLLCELDIIDFYSFKEWRGEVVSIKIYKKYNSINENIQ